MTPMQALECAIANAMGSLAEYPDYRATRIMNNLHGFRFTVAPMPDRLTFAESAKGDAVKAFAQAILHGDAEHQKWLLEAADAFTSDRALPPARNDKGLMAKPAEIRDVPGWEKAGPGTPLGVELETMHQDEYNEKSPHCKHKKNCTCGGALKYPQPGICPCINSAREFGVEICRARILVAGDEIEWIDSHGYSTLMNPGSFKAPTHWRWWRGNP